MSVTVIKFKDINKIYRPLQGNKQINIKCYNENSITYFPKSKDEFKNPEFLIHFSSVFKVYQFLELMEQTKNGMIKTMLLRKELSTKLVHKKSDDTGYFGKESNDGDIGGS